MIKKIVITGGFGFIGARFVRHFQSKNIEVVVMEHPLSKKPENFPDCEIVRGDITERDFIDSVKVEGVDAILHLAAQSSGPRSFAIPETDIKINILGTLNTIDWCLANNINRFLFASSFVIYGDHPDRESLDEKTYYLPKSVYATSKLAAENLVREFCGLNDKKSTIFRFYKVVGSSGYEPTNVDGLMYNLMKARQTGEFNLFGTDYDTPDGTCVRDYVHILEVCEAIRNAIEQPISGRDLENLGSGIGYTVKQMIETFKRVNECDFEVNYLPRREGDLAKSVLNGVSPYMRVKYTIDEMMKV
jgi:UDP-glucose 4-epimerase